MTGSVKTDFSQAVTTLKRDLREQTNRSLSAFEADTGVSPTSVRFEMVEVTRYGDNHKSYVLGDVVIGFGEY